MHNVKTIMLVDDSANILTKEGYAVEKAWNAAEGLAKFKAGARSIC